MELELRNKVALVTGSSRGIGRSIAEVLHHEGCHVALNARNLESLVKVADTIPGSLPVQGDVTCEKEAKKIVSQVIGALGKLDILICNVGNGKSVPPGEETYEEWQKVFSQNLWSTTNMVEAARESLAISHGSIVCISSICGIEVIHGAPITYSTAKAALHAYVRGIARPLGKQGVRINAIAPGNILFDGSVWSRKLVENKNDVQEILKRDVSLNRLGSPSDVANLAAYLASPRSNFVTGSIWALDGGQIHSQ